MDPLRKDLEGDQEFVVRDDADATTLAKHNLTGEIVHHLKKANDGHTILIPQPTDDPRDPLNWRPWKKWAVLLSISVASMLVALRPASYALLIEIHLQPARLRIWNWCSHYNSAGI